MEGQKTDERTIGFANKTVVNLKLYLGRYGVKIDDAKSGAFENGKGLTFFISVPSSSDLILDSGEAAQGEALAKYAKEVIAAEERKNFSDLLKETSPLSLIFLDENHPRVKVMSKTREEHWTINKEIEANVESIALSMILNKKN